MKNTDQLHIIFQKYLNQSCSPDEMTQLLDYFAMSESDEDTLGQLVEEVLNRQETSAVDVETGQRLKICLENIMENRVMPSKRKVWLKPIYVKWTVAATLFMAACTIFYFTQIFKPNTVGHNAVTQASLKPGTDKAQLTLADGSVIDLEQAANGKLENKEGIAVTKTADGKLVYDTQQEVPVGGEVTYNTVVTPRGGQYKIILSDGSSIWLNAASSLRFPTSFVGAERRVELSGEGYFEIKKNARQPFVVASGEQEVTVLGTHFNINAYNDNNLIKTTLLEGAVKISKGKQSYVLAPGQQASLDNSHNVISIANNVDIDAVVAWKHGRFSFDETNIKDVMQQVTRWYDVDVLYKGDFSNVELTGNISRGEDAEQVLKLLKGTKQIDFIINGRTITVIPYK
ncbi:FecR family protein [Pedobacter nyackensis]|uniref:FecR family protein n=1 Tax=Pedobacter nyackensis TaxID=475255 RepID=UPI00292D14C5|nr:FecR domain-containing protein [Pedobacter nyackensis]